MPDRGQQEMRVAIIGAGRIGTAIGGACAAAGHDVVVAVRKAHTSRVKDLPVVSGDRPAVDADLVILAAALEDPEKYESDEDMRRALGWMSRLSPGTPVASVVAPLSLHGLREIAGPRPLARFLCTPAVRDPEAVRFHADESAPAAVEKLRAALPSAQWLSVPAERLDRYGQRGQSIRGS